MRIAFVLTMSLLLLVPSVQAESIADRQQFRLNNPDGKKYEFVKSFLMGLEYLKEIEDRNAKWDNLSKEDLENIDNLKELAAGLIQDNTDMLVAKNMLRKFRTPQNGLILKTTDLFQNLCDELIVINKEEQLALKTLLQQESRNDEMDYEGYLDQKKALIAQRKATSQNLLEAAFLVTKVLVSPKENFYGRLETLGVTSKQRRSLIQRLKKFNGEEYSGDLREGQTFLQGSIVVIREILEDMNWDSLDT